MTPTEFCYWLQGAIEIGDLDHIDACKVERIVRTLQNVAPHNVFTLSSLMLFHHYESQSVFDDIKIRLQEIFVHDIDPNYEGDQQYFHDLHRGNVTSIST